MFRSNQSTLTMRQCTFVKIILLYMVRYIRGADGASTVVLLSLLPLAVLGVLALQIIIHYSDLIKSNAKSINARPLLFFFLNYLQRNFRKSLVFNSRRYSSSVVIEKIFRISCTHYYRPSFTTYTF
jgi:hypothetical protein